MYNNKDIYEANAYSIHNKEHLKKAIIVVAFTVQRFSDLFR